MTALRRALAETSDRSPLHRALMQADAWAAHDTLLHDQGLRRNLADPIWKRRDELVALLGRFIKKVAMSAAEIRSLPDNYAFGTREK